MRQFLRRMVNLPRYGPVALHDPQQQVQVFFHGRGEPWDVTPNNVVAALRPFTLGVMFQSQMAPAGESSLRLWDRARQRTVGVIHLRPSRSIALPGYRFELFETAGCENHCVPAASLGLYGLREKWRARQQQRKNPFNFRMTAQDLHCSWAFYLCPRPVVLVTVEHQGAGNMFPMDLIGPTVSPYFSMALRLTSPAVRLMQESRRMALASVPFRHQAVAYQLGKHHRLPSIDVAALPFATVPSPEFRLPVMQDALRIREVRVEECHEVGSHMLFLTKVVRDSLPESAGEPQLFHAFRDGR